MTAVQDDLDLLRRCAAGPAPDALRALVDRHIDFVYAIALRKARDPGVAEDVTQAVFILLSRKAGSIKPSSLAGWLYSTTHYCAANLIRSEQRRRQHEQRAARPEAQMQTTSLHLDRDELLSVLDRGLDQLRGSDREVILLRYLQGREFSEISSILGISQDSARQRVTRALDRLRRHFAVQGTALTSAALTAALQAAPISAPSHLAHAVTAAINSHTATSVASTLAAKTSHVLISVRIKVAAALIATVAVATVGTTVAVKVLSSDSPKPPIQIAANLPVVQPAPVPAAPALPAEAPSDFKGVFEVARWDAFVNDAGFNLLQNALQPIQTSSQNYQGYSTTSDDLRAILHDVESQHGIDWYGNRVTMGYQSAVISFPIQFTCTHDARGSDKFNIGCTVGQDQENFIPSAGRLHALIDVRNMVISAFSADGPAKKDTNASIHYESDLNSGDAIVFIASFSSPDGIPCHHVAIWETFKVRSYQRRFVSLLDKPQWWRERGPSGVRAAVDIAAVWTAQAPESATPPPEFVKKLDDGQIVQLGAITSLDHWLFCWWDAAGHPVNPPASMTISDEPGDVGMAMVQNPQTREQRIQASPLGKPSLLRWHGDDWHPIFVPVSGQISVQLPRGPWRKLGRLTFKEPLNIDGREFRITSTQPAGNRMFYANLNYIQGSPEAYDLTAVTADGVEHQHSDRMGAVPMTMDGKLVITGTLFEDLALSDVQYFNVWQRSAQTITFNHITLQPNPRPPESVTQAQIDNAIPILAHRSRLDDVAQNTQSLQKLADDRKAWARIPPDPTTPNGVLRLMLDAAVNGDLATVESHLITTSAAQPDLATLEARNVVAARSFRQLVLARFGEAGAIEALDGFDGWIDYELNWLRIPWEQQADGSLTMGQMALAKNTAGQYELREPSPTPAQAAYFQSWLDRSEKLTKLLTDNPNMTLPQFEAAVEDSKAE